ncbi:plastocyanin [Roseateles asaccharophilus]|uniref:Plastocyanin n=1 Tax=Roseateles asaccharophilus TaxID=582607 RepID=A0ABU2A5Q5_9BURK|nr:plastocyanin [Roseateles asaccharophilus]MDR7332345.1 plastocyanin [Roseateles asaccharophilus]
MRYVLTFALLAAALAAQAADLTVTVLDRNGKPLADAVVLVDSSVQGARPAPVLEASIAQEKLRFVPAVTVVGLGAKVSFSNLDSWDHHVILGVMGAGGVYVDPGQNTQFRLAGRVAGKPPAGDSKVLSQPGAYLLGCHIHGSMRGHVYVADTPWARLGGEDGKAVLRALPEGPARVRIWHADQLVEGTPTPVQIVAAGSAVTVHTQITAARRKPAPAAESYIGL